MLQFESAKLHWLRHTTGKNLRDISRIIGGIWSPPERTGAFGCMYKSVDARTGIQVYHQSKTGQQPSVVECTGDVCERDGGSGLLSNVMLLRSKVTRVDVAVDVRLDDPRAEMMLMRQQFIDGKCDTKIRKFAEYRSYGEGEGFTWYFGARTGTFLRVYDRRGVLRLEWQCKPEGFFADHAAEFLGVDDFGYMGLWRSLSDRIRFPLKWYDELLRGKIVPLPAGPAISSSAVAYCDSLRVSYGEVLQALAEAGVDLGRLLGRRGADGTINSRALKMLFAIAESGLLSEVDSVGVRGVAESLTGR